MINLSTIQECEVVMLIYRQIEFVLSGFSQHLTSHLGRYFSKDSYRYDFSNDQANCFDSYSANPGSLMRYPVQ